jgi:magnesium transporter
MAEDLQSAPSMAQEVPDFRNNEDAISELFLAGIERAVENGEASIARAFTTDLHETDLGELLETLEPETRASLVQLLGEDFDFSALNELDEPLREEILEDISNEAIAAGVAELDTDDAVSIIETLEPEDRAEVLAAIPLDERVVIERGLDYPEGSAGRLMQADLVAVPSFWTVGRTIDFCRETEDLPERFYDLFVVDPAHRLLGTVSLDRLLRTKRPVLITDLVEEVEHAIHASDEVVEAAQLFQRYNLVSAPVVGPDERLVGVLTHDDMIDVITEEADAEIKALGGVSRDESLSSTVLQTTRSRFWWLFVNLITAISASAVIGVFEDSLKQMVALAVLMPIVASMGGNAGTQTMTVIVRALATDEIDRSNLMTILIRECSVGFLNGVAFALIMGAVAGLWFHNPALGGVVGLALVANLVAASFAGVLIPMSLARANQDPAVSSGPFVTTVTDITGFFVFLGMATLWFRL